MPISNLKHIWSHLGLNLRGRQRAGDRGAPSPDLDPDPHLTPTRNGELRVVQPIRDGGGGAHLREGGVGAREKSVNW